MAFFLTPRFAPAYHQQQECGPFACAPPRRRHVASPSVPSFMPFLSQIDGLISELDREARRAAAVQQARQERPQPQPKKVFRARFDVREHGDSYAVEGEVPGFEQENIAIEVTDEHTLKIRADTQQHNEEHVAETEVDRMDGLTLNEHEPEHEHETEIEPARAASPAHSDISTASHKSYQPTVEDDYEDLGAETSSTVSSSSSAAPAEPKGKEKAVEETAVQHRPQPEAPVQVPQQQQQQQQQERHWLSERVHGSFERTFQFPERIDMGNVRASLRNGVLSVSVPKARGFEVRRIVIQ